MADFTENVFVAVGYKLVFFAQTDGFVSLRVVSPEGEIIEIKNADSFNTTRVLNQTNSGLGAKVIMNNSQISQKREAITQQESILNNPSSTPEQKAAAQKAINNYNSEIGVLQNTNIQYNQIITYLQTTGVSDFSALVTEAKTAVEPSPNPPTPTVGTDATGNASGTTTNTNTLAGPASDDSGSTPTNTATTQPTGSSNNTDTAIIDEETPVVNAPETDQDSEEGSSEIGEPGSPPYDNEGFIRVPATNSRPGRRLKNPLGYLASYTYQLSLYMISPDAYEAFIASGRKNIFVFNEEFANSDAAIDAGDRSKGGAFLVAQSAGMGRPEYRAEGFDLDYYIDNLSFEAVIAGKESNGPVANTSYRFKIVEPYGFSFVSKLKRAQEALVKNSGGKGTGQYLKGGNPTKMFYILGIRFFGWDKFGNQILGDEPIDGNPLDPNAPGTGALFETFYDIVITEFKFKIDGNATTYDIRAETASIAGSVNATKGMVTDAKPLSGTAVRDFISGPKGLLTALNKDQAALVKNKSQEYPIIYRVKWLGNDAENIALAKLTTPNKTKKNNQAGSNAENTKQSNDKSAIDSAPNKNVVTHTADKNTPIIQVIEQLISQSTYMTDAMTKNYKDADEYDPDTDSPPSVPGTDKTLTWFNISPELSDIRWDKKRKDWAYTITYVIQTYFVPCVESPYVSKTTKYYGPHKRYDYWYTGQNTEVLGYEQKIDNQFFLALLDDPENKNTGDSGNTSSSPTQGGKNAVNTEPGGDKSNSKGTPSLSAVNSFRTSLYDPSSFATAKIQILGDPDFLLHDSLAGTGSGGKSLDKAYNKFYDIKDGFTVNPTGGQVFIEIDFKEAVDYSREGLFIDDVEGAPPIEGQPGTLSINDSIEFWRYPEEIAGQIRGVSYQVLSVTNTFQNGAFKQTLQTVINPQAAEGAVSDEGKREQEDLVGEEPDESEGTLPDPKNADTNITEAENASTTNPDNAG